jgi:pimeloyl-ACP methyl ester carboxylesterase
MMRSRVAFLLFCGSLAASAPALAATAPGQPKSGPGGSDYVATEVVKRAVGRAGAVTYVFHAPGIPSEARPVVVFLPAWGAVNPQTYGGWIEHLARRGNLVLYPRFQEVGRTRPADATEKAASLVKEALAELANDPAAKPDLGRVAFLGHSAGAGMAFNLAALAKEQGLPTPKLVFGYMAGGLARDAKSRGIQLADLSRIDPSTLLVTMIGDREQRPSEVASRRLLGEASEVPAARKVFMRALSDSHGFPVLSATLASPASPKDEYDREKIKLPPDPPRDPKAPRERGQNWSADMVLSGEQTVLLQQLGNNATDALDYLAFWRTFDAAAAAAFAGKDGQALQTDPGFTDMGRWSDGWPVKRLFAETPRAEALVSTPRREVSPALLPVPSKRRPQPSQKRR